MKWSERATTTAVVIGTMLIGGLVVVIGTQAVRDTRRQFNAVCEAVGGTPMYDGRQHVCLQKCERPK